MLHLYFLQYITKKIIKHYEWSLFCNKVQQHFHELLITSRFSCLMSIIRSVCKTQIDVQSLIDVQSSNRRPILKYMAVFALSQIDVQWRHWRILSFLFRLALLPHDIPIGGDVCSNSREHISRSGEVSVFNTWEHIHQMCLSIVYGFVVGLCSQFYMTEFEARLSRHTWFHYARILKLSLRRYYTG